MKNTFQCGNLGLTVTKIYCESLRISYKKIINKICVEPLCIKLEILHSEIIMNDVSFTHSKCKQHSLK